MMERAPPLWTGHTSQSQCHYLTRGTRPPPSYYHVVYDTRVERPHDAPFSFSGDRAGSMETGVMGGTLYSEQADGTLAPALYRRRGGLVDQRDVIKAHESHKLQSTPKARRKEWE